jgi:1-acyl-sn-glycerol-3-phosphate acyltransferase
VSSIHSDLEGAIVPPEYSSVLKKPNFLSRSAKNIFEVYCKILFTFYCPLKIIGKGNIPKNTSFIFCSNHNSHMDSGILMVASGLPFRNFAMIAAKDYFFDSKKRNYLNLLMNLIPIERDADRKSMIDYLAACREFTKNGNRNLIVYPEGTRSKTGKIQTFKKGPAMISAELGLPIVPAFIKGSFRAWPKGKIFMKPSKLSITIGKPISPDKYTGDDYSEGKNFHAYKRITEELEKRIHELKNAGEKNA